MAKPMLTIDASALDTFNSKTFVAEVFDGFDDADTTYYGGTPDSAYGGTYYVNGSQVLNRYSADTTETDYVTVLDGTEIAYDFIHHGASFGHGISGEVDSLVFGMWVEGTTTAEEGTGAAGRVDGLDTLLTIDGLGLSADPGAGNDLETNAVYALYKAVQTFDADAIMELISGYSIKLLGSAGDDVLKGFDLDDVLNGGAGDDVLRAGKGADALRGGEGADSLYGARGDDFLGGGEGNDTLVGGKGDDTIRGGKGADELRGGGGDDKIIGGAGKDILVGGDGADVFFFQPGSGVDTIRDFGVAMDRIDLSALDVASFDDVSTKDVAAGVRLTADGVSILLNGVGESDLSAELFLF
ncbi:calcium-binding protein [Tropicimonas marinistellae]|uniref:calcium-binding protein n=1 Tax=Tropicimonas marinistellae TaxID=1739787 RepID=UPI000836DA9E|nr:calcium-binding protein [Tropicimonas marinistellae]